MKHLVIAFVAIFTICSQYAYSHDQDVAKLNRFMQNKGNTASMQIFREGRDFIEAQNWQKAAEKFKDFITGYPKDRDLDAALYWYGYALQKQNRSDDAAVPLLRLMNRFPNSSWRNDAQALLVVMGRKAEVEQALQRDTAKVLESARSGDDPAVRLYAIRFIGDLKDAAVLDELIKIYDADKTR